MTVRGHQQELSFNSLSRDHFVELVEKYIYDGSDAFNSLSRDHYIGMFGVKKPKMFTLSTPSLGIT